MDYLDRETYKKIKGMNREQMNVMLDVLYKQGQANGESAKVNLAALREELAAVKGIGDKRLDQIMDIIAKHITAEQA